MPSVASMTGYAALDGKTLAGTVTAECRSVNSRFLDLTLRLDDALRFTEPAVRERLQKRLTRGKVELRLNLTADASALPASVNAEALRRVLALQETILKLDPQALKSSTSPELPQPKHPTATSSSRKCSRSSTARSTNSSQRANARARPSCRSSRATATRCRRW